MPKFAINERSGSLETNKMNDNGAGEKEISVTPFKQTTPIISMDRDLAEGNENCLLIETLKMSSHLESQHSETNSFNLQLHRIANKSTSSLQSRVKGDHFEETLNLPLCDSTNKLRLMHKSVDSLESYHEEKQNNNLPFCEDVDDKNDAKFQMKQTLRQIEDMILKINQIKQSKGAKASEQAMEATQFNLMIQTL